MTCEELRSHFEKIANRTLRMDRAATEHFSVCADCSRFAEERGGAGTKFDVCPPIGGSSTGVARRSRNRQVSTFRRRTRTDASLEPGPLSFVWARMGVGRRRGSRTRGDSFLGIQRKAHGYDR